MTNDTVKNTLKTLPFTAEYKHTDTREARGNGTDTPPLHTHFQPKFNNLSGTTDKNELSTLKFHIIP